MGVYDYVNNIEWEKNGDLLVNRDEDVVLGRNLIVLNVFKDGSVLSRLIREAVKSGKSDAIHEIFGTDSRTTSLRVDMADKEVHAFGGGEYLGDTVVIDGLTFHYYNTSYFLFRKNSTMKVHFSGNQKKPEIVSFLHVEKKRNVTAKVTLNNMWVDEEIYEWILKLAKEERIIETFEKIHPELRKVEIDAKSVINHVFHGIIHVETRLIKTMGAIIEPHVLTLFGWPFKTGVYSVTVDLRKHFDLREKDVKLFRRQEGVIKVRKTRIPMKEELPEGWNLGYNHKKRSVIFEKNGTTIAFEKGGAVIESNRLPKRIKVSYKSDEYVILMNTLRQNEASVLMI